MQTDYDIIVVGGGMVGATFACLLGDTRLRIAVLEAKTPQLEWPRADFDNRVSAVTRATERVFRSVGAWEGMVARRVQSYEQMHVWDATGSGSIRFAAADLGEPNLGYIIENEAIWGALLDRMAAFDNITLISPAEVDGLTIAPGAATVMLEGRRSLSARLVVGSDGSRSRVRQQAGIDAHGWPYEQTAVVATIKTAKPHQEACWQRFLPTGPLAFLPLPDGYSSIVWSTTPEQADELLDMEDEDFLRALHQAFGDTLGGMASTGPRGGYSLSLQHATAYVRERLALIGNAAHTIHPLAGQGLNIGVSDAAALAQVLEEAGTEEIGSFRLLRRYERWRKGDNLSVMFAMDGFKRLFSNAIPPLAWARNLGLNLTDQAVPVKNLLMRRALGLSGDLPRRCLEQTD